MDWTRFSPDEMERRRIASIATLKAKDQAVWDQKYQEICDTEYFKAGPCCAGCDHWISDMGLMGNCKANGVVPSGDVLRSLDISFSSYMPKPGFPFTRAEFHCGKFKDDFDWKSLPYDYLKRIGYYRRHPKEAP